MALKVLREININQVAAGGYILDKTEYRERKDAGGTATEASYSAEHSLSVHVDAQEAMAEIRRFFGIVGAN